METVLAVYKISFISVLLLLLPICEINNNKSIFGKFYINLLVNIQETIIALSIYSNVDA